MARNSDRLTLPNTDTARSNTRYNPASAAVAEDHADKQHADEGRQLEDAPASSCATTLPSVRQMAIRAILSISTSEVITRPTSGFSKAVGAT